jgi:hypothetical protein
VQFGADRASPALIRVLDKIPNTREEEGPPRTGEDVYNALGEMRRLAEKEE